MGGRDNRLDILAYQRLPAREAKLHRAQSTRLA
jgi:hypothetical protein